MAALPKQGLISHVANLDKTSSGADPRADSTDQINYLTLIDSFILQANNGIYSIYQTIRNLAVVNRQIKK